MTMRRRGAGAVPGLDHRGRVLRCWRSPFSSSAACCSPDRAPASPSTIAGVMALFFLMMRERLKTREQLRRALLVGVAVAIVIGLLAGGQMIRKISSFEQADTANRLIIWRTAAKAIGDSPWWGWGLGSFADIYAVYQPKEIVQPNDKAHSTPIETVVELGIPGAVASLAGGADPLGHLPAGRLAPPTSPPLSAGSRLCGLGIAILHSIVDFSLQIPAIGFVVSAFLGHGLGADIFAGRRRRIGPLRPTGNKLYSSSGVVSVPRARDLGCTACYCRDARAEMMISAAWAWRKMARPSEGALSLRGAMPVGAGAVFLGRTHAAPAIRSAPQRFLETWLDAMGGFLFCVVLPIPIYATGEPFAGGIGATEQTILATAVGLCDRLVLRPPARCLSARHPARQHRLRRAGRGHHLRDDRRAAVAAALGLFARPAVRQRLADDPVDGVRRPAAGALPAPQLRRHAVKPDRRRCRRCRPAVGSTSRTSSATACASMPSWPISAPTSPNGRSRRWPARRSPACRCSTAATSSRP